MNEEEEEIMKDLEKNAFIVDVLPENFPIGAMFIMSGYSFLHLQNRYCMVVKFSDDLTEFAKA